MPSATYVVISHFIHLEFPFKPVEITGHCPVSTFQVCLEDVRFILKLMYDSLQVPVCVAVSECNT